MAAGLVAVASRSKGSDLSYSFAWKSGTGLIPYFGYGPLETARLECKCSHVECKCSHVECKFSNIRCTGVWCMFNSFDVRLPVNYISVFIGAWCMSRTHWINTAVYVKTVLQ